MWRHSGHAQSSISCRHVNRHGLGCIQQAIIHGLHEIAPVQIASDKYQLPQFGSTIASRRVPQGQIIDSFECKSRPGAIANYVNIEQFFGKLPYQETSILSRTANFIGSMQEAADELCLKEDYRGLITVLVAGVFFCVEVSYN